jgi:diphthine-ammonia ligase
MRVGVLFSGGKDSALALYKARKFHDVVCLISLVSINPESYMFHVPNIELTKMQAKAIGLHLLRKTTKGEKEDELQDLMEILSVAKAKLRIEGVVTGAIKSVYQASRIQRICSDLDLWCFNPLWLKDQVDILNELVQRGFKTVVSGVFAFPLDESFLGKEIDDEMIGRLQEFFEEYALNPAGEGGEMETTVTDAPFFKKRIEILDFDVSFKNNSGVFKIKKASLVAK